MWNKIFHKIIKIMVLSITVISITCSFSYAGLQSEITLSTFGAIIQNIEGRDSDDYMAYQYTPSGWTITPAKIYYWVHGKDPNTTSFTPTSVTLKIYKGSDLIKTKELPKEKGEQQTTWDGKITSDTLVEPGKYTATIEVEYAGKKAISREHKITVFKAEIKAADGIKDPPKFILVDKLITYKAKFTPEGITEGFKWEITSGTSKASIEGGTIQQSVVIKGLQYSDTIDDVTLSIKFKPSGMTDWVEIASHPFTVVEIESFLIRDNNNYWNLIKHTPNNGRYWDHKQIVDMRRREVIVAAEMSTSSARVNMEIITKPANLENKIIWRALGANVSPESGNFDSSGKSSANITGASSNQEGYNFYVGIDLNVNGSLDTDTEARGINKVRLLPKSHLINNYLELFDLTRIADIAGYDISSTHAFIFLGYPQEADIPSEIKPSTINRLETKLTHPVGAGFSPATGTASLDLRKFAPDSKTARKIAASTALRTRITEDLAAHKNEILNFFAQNNSPNNKIFQFVHPEAELEFKEDVDGKDLNFAFGDADSPYTLTVRVRRDSTSGQLTIPLLFADGDVIDLYDWDFYFGGGGWRFDQEFATIQFAWRSPPSNVNAGRIFRINVKFRAKLENFPFPE